VKHEQLRQVRWLAWALWGLALVGLAYLVGLTIWLGVTGLIFPYQLDYGEGLVLHFTNEWAHGRPIYKAIEGYPYITANYPPLTMVLALALTPVLGLSYAAGRVWTLLAVLATTAIIMAWLLQLGLARSQRNLEDWLPAVAAGLLFAGSPYIYHWAPLFRVDLVGLALTLGGLYAVARGSGDRPEEKTDRQRGWWLWLAVLLFVAGLYAKQSFVFAPAAALVYLFFFVDRGQAVKLGAAMAVLGGGLFLFINVVTDGGFWQGLVVSNVNPFLWGEFWKQQADFLGIFAVLGLLAAWYLVDKFILDQSTPLRTGVTVLDLYLVAALASLLLAGKAGAWENYFFEALAALTLCGGLGLARLSRRRAWLVQILAPLLVLAQVALMWHTPRVALDYLQLSRESNDAIIPILAGISDPIASEDMGLLVTQDKVLDYCSFQYSQLARAGRWDQSWELGQLRGRQFSSVILEQGTRLDVDRYQRFTREFLSELDRNYQRTQSVGKYELYEADALQHERRAEFGDDLALVGWSVRGPDLSSAVGIPAGGLHPGDTVHLTIVWQAQRALSTDYTAFAHLVDRDGQGRAADDHQPHGGLYPTSAWGSGEMVRDVFSLTIPASTPSGLYEVQIGWYNPATEQRLPVGGANAWRVAILPVSWSPGGQSTLTPVGGQFAEAATLEGYAWKLDSGVLALTLRWMAVDSIDSDYSVFVHLVDPAAADRLVSQGDAPPFTGRWPTSLWLPGIPLNDTYTVPLPADLAAGAYDLLVGLYEPSTGERLRLPDGRDAIRLEGIQIDR
jgi:hypothetical protein